MTGALDHLWAGWRAAYVTGAGEAAAPGGGAGACLFCRLQELGDDEAFVVERTPLAFTVMNAFPYTTGHVMVAPVRHVGELEDLTPGEAAAVFAGVQRAVRAMKAVLRPDGLNIGANLGRVAGAGVPDHFHVHALPRWSGDTNFMTTVAETRVLPEDLRTTWTKLREGWPRD